VRKILSILVALGLVLGLSAIATPVAADVTAATVIPVSACAGKNATYNITFNVTGDLVEGGTTVTIDFPVDTDVSKLVSITVTNVAAAGSPAAVPAAWITVAGQKVTFYSPLHVVAAADPVVNLIIVGIFNPTTGGSYKLKVNTSAPVDTTPVESKAYVIKPAKSTYKFGLDFGPTYAGIAKDFVPPFKACGQVGYGTNYTNKWFTVFNLSFATDVLGCAVPCANTTLMYMHLTKAPTGATFNISFNQTGVFMNPVVCTKYNVQNITLAVNMTYNWELELHVDKVGEYELCFEVVCPAGALTCPECSAEPVTIAKICLPITAHQWKDAGKIILEEKWNLVSLPLVPFNTDIGALLASLPAEATDGDTVDELIRIDHYDRTGCPTGGTWLTYGNGQTSLTTMEDGKSYWVKLSYPAGNYTWWVWGTEKPMPPKSPSEYPVCSGWNMFGFTRLTSLAVDSYLWNWGVAPAADPVIYRWDNTGTWTSSGWKLVNWLGSELLIPGDGFWGAFPGAGFIYVP
jgi:hypothetical protein